MHTHKRNLYETMDIAMAHLIKLPSAISLSNSGLYNAFQTALVSCILLGFSLRSAESQVFNGGTVTFGEAFHIQGCRNIFAVANPSGYSIILWVGGAPVLDRDLLSGNLKTVGQAVLTNHTRKQDTTVYVEDAYLSLQAFRSRIAKGCPS